ncbi:hypothetical protein BCR43DRAFT_151958 [Syncephalastrum racemosum]|uniref:F-box domain-containing protein n=1 Tax=Syncephalastrum racemosum TaxID=13706 RepID=A0A1X2HN14_SYNRA|nr:hypothetical protein BCR43DRAFT_151958 [Syncephalastrum racemosum]
MREPFFLLSLFLRTWCSALHTWLFYSCTAGSTQPFPLFNKMDQDPSYPLSLLPCELQVEIFRNNTRTLTVAMQVNRAWQGQLEPLHETFTELNIDLSDRRLQDRFGEAVVAFFHRALTSISIKAMDVPWWLYNATNASIHRTRVTHLDITSWHRRDDLRRDLIFRRVLPDDFVFAVFQNLTSLYMETDRLKGYLKSMVHETDQALFQKHGVLPVFISAYLLANLIELTENIIYQS